MIRIGRTPKQQAKRLAIQQEEAARRSKWIDRMKAMGLIPWNDPQLGPGKPALLGEAQSHDERGTG
jgi:hypothetical protein